MRGAKLIISAVTATAAADVARDSAAVLTPGQLFVDINSVSPAIKRASAARVEAAGAHYIDAAVMAPVPPQRLAVPMLLGGPRAEELSPALNSLGFATRAVSTEVGVASAIKMCRSVMIKGIEALTVECLLAARHYGAEQAVLQSLAATFPSMGWAEAQPDYLICRVAEHGRRRAAEMREVARTVADAGLAPHMALATAARQDGLVDDMQAAGIAYDPAHAVFLARARGCAAEATRAPRRTALKNRSPAKASPCSSASLVFTAFFLLFTFVYTRSCSASSRRFLPFRGRFALARSGRACCCLRSRSSAGSTIASRAREPARQAQHRADETLLELGNLRAGRMLPPQAWVLKRELTWIPFVGWGMRLLRAIAIDRGAGGAAVRQMIEQGRERLAAGMWIVVFPEGTRMPPGETRRYGVGGAAVAAETGALVVPVAHNAGYFWPRRGLLKKPGTIRVVIGKPIVTQGSRRARDQRGSTALHRSALRPAAARLMRSESTA